MKQKKDINGRIKKGLFSDYPRNTLTNSLVVCLSKHGDSTENNKSLRLYSVFKSYLEYGIYQLKLPQQERCFYEIILGETSQKPHFDLDIDDLTVNKEKVKDNLIDNVIKQLENKGITLDLAKDILVYTSHGSKKYSYHIIVNNYCHANNIEAKSFYYKVIENINPSYVQWIDRSVYSPTQQFRIVGSQKIDTDRVKTFNKTWSYYGQTIEHMYPEEPDSPEHEMVMQLESSTISYTGNCNFLPPFEPKINTIRNYDTDTEDITTEDATEAIKLIAAAGNISIHDSIFPYKFMGINGAIVMLKRVKASNCKVCNRIHEHENPYLLVVGEEKNVYFFCRRAPQNKKLFLGRLSPYSPIDCTDNNTDANNTNKNTKNNNDVNMMVWSKNVIDRVKKIARNGKKNEKNIQTEVDPVHKKMLIDLYLKK